MHGMPESLRVGSLVCMGCLSMRVGSPWGAGGTQQPGWGVPVEQGVPWQPSPGLWGPELEGGVEGGISLSPSHNLHSRSLPIPGGTGRSGSSN